MRNESAHTTYKTESQTMFFLFKLSSFAATTFPCAESLSMRASPSPTPRARIT